MPQNVGSNNTYGIDADREGLDLPDHHSDSHIFRQYIAWNTFSEYIYS